MRAKILTHHHVLGNLQHGENQPGTWQCYSLEFVYFFLSRECKGMATIFP